jgi:hypothetical protein
MYYLVASTAMLASPVVQIETPTQKVGAFLIFDAVFKIESNYS